MSDDMVERVARAIVERACGKGAPIDAEDMAIARAAIEAMRTPTEAMKVNGGLKAEAMMFDGEGTGFIFEDMGAVFTCMIDAALSPPLPVGENND